MCFVLFCFFVFFKFPAFLFKAKVIIGETKRNYKILLNIRLVVPIPTPFLLIEIDISGELLFLFCFNKKKTTTNSRRCSPPIAVAR